ncbi:hypothetical protein VHEMI09163 [[Torrubiella] hemipterigena]|uniref:Aminoglycoside phosphotransferase domain-containing protein n=1 Tax=[Torrubiella] hemipterigena TaxID=1531966 RepID=A0A0A1TPI7_9HYPO|nr:hypothetical protein VHEMI09163 [[Torrubiella] hemipterigena]
MASSKPVSTDVLTAFGVDADAPLKALPGGSLVCYLAGDNVVLRPSEDDVESQQIAEILRKLNNLMQPSAPYRVSNPVAVATNPNCFVYCGWTAWSFVSGEPREEFRWDESLRTCRGFHHDIGKIGIVKPEFISRRMNRFREADLVAWGEKGLDQLPVTTNPAVLSRIEAPMRRLEALKREFTHDLPNQLVHGDMAGNMLFDEDGKLPPGIIDMTFYWRPGGLGAAIMVADRLLWNDEGDEAVKMYGTDADSIQLLLRALLFRIVTWAIDIVVVDAEPDRIWAEKMLPVVDFEAAVEIVSKFVTLDD